MHFAEELITPAVAEEYLKQNVNNDTLVIHTRMLSPAQEK